ncbi:transposase family protein [Bacillus sp. N9]
MFSVLLELPEFEVVNQETFDTHYLVHIEKNTDEERCTYCGFHSSFVHDKRTRKIRDLSVLNKPLYLIVCIKRYRCQNCDEVFSPSFESVASHQRYTNRFRQFIYEQVLGTTIQDISRKQRLLIQLLNEFSIQSLRKKLISMKMSFKKSKKIKTLP